MHIRGGVGARLREERERLDKNQEGFGSIAGVSRRTQAAYEADSNSPTVAYLTEISGAGADVLYILTGDRSSQGLTAEEGGLIACFRILDEERKTLVIQLCRSLVPDRKGLR